jgi:hypothetical protein
MMTTRYNLVCPQGSTFYQKIVYKIDDVVVDLTAYDAKMHVREKHSSADAIVYLSTFGYNPTIILGDEGTVEIMIDATTTAAFYPKEYVYDLEIIDGATVSRLVEGKFIVTPEVTR